MTQINKWPMDTLAQPMSLAATEQASGLSRLQFIKRLLNQGLQVFQGVQDAVLAWQNLNKKSDFFAIKINVQTVIIRWPEAK